MDNWRTAYQRGYQIAKRAYRLGGLDAIAAVAQDAGEARRYSEKMRKSLGRGIESFRMHIVLGLPI